MSAVSFCRAKGAGSRGSTCSFAVISPSRSEGGYLRFSNREKWLTSFAVKKKYVTLLGGLRHRIHVLAAAFHGNEGRRRRRVAIPDVVMDELEMPDPFARRSIERDQAIGKQIVSNSVCSIKI